MGVQDNTERVLRSLHILLSKSEVYPREPSKVIVDKDQMLRLLNNLSKCITDMMDHYELTTESRDQAEREFQKHGDQIVLKANHKAEDVYAASVMYTDEALNSIQDIMEDTSKTLDILFEEMNRRMKDERQRLRTNQLELRSQLQDLADTEKYLKIIEDRNRQIEKEKREQEERQAALVERNIYADRSTGIKINKEYFEMMGIPIEEDVDREEREKYSQTEQTSAYETASESRSGKHQDKPKRRWGAFRKEEQHPQLQSKNDFPFEVQDLALDEEIADLGLVMNSSGAIPPDPELARRAADVKIRVDADAEYFRWKEEQERIKQQYEPENPEINNVHDTGLDQDLKLEEELKFNVREISEALSREEREAKLDEELQKIVMDESVPDEGYTVESEMKNTPVKERSVESGGYVETEIGYMSQPVQSSQPDMRYGTGLPVEPDMGYVSQPVQSSDAEMEYGTVLPAEPDMGYMYESIESDLKYRTGNGLSGESETRYEPETEFENQSFSKTDSPIFSESELIQKSKESSSTMSEDHRIDLAAKEAEEELSAGIHAIWQSMTETLRQEELAGITGESDSEHEEQTE